MLALYSTLIRDFERVPDPRTSEWLDFGFCLCEDASQREALAKAYLELLDSDASLSQIASAWKGSSLGQLMKDKGVREAAALESIGIEFRRPDWEKLGIYRLIAEVYHGLSGCYCRCFSSTCPAHSKYEALLSTESEGDYGFHGTNPWERWQLLNFYFHHVFTHPAFSARAMQEARRDPDAGQLDNYLDSIVPDFRRKILLNKHLCDGMFPKLGAKVHFRNGPPQCSCVIHTVTVSEGLARS